MALYEDHLFCAEAGRLALCGDDFTCRSGSAPSWSPLSLLNPVLVLPCRCRPVEHADLMAQSEVLEPEGSTRPEDRGQRCEECREKNEHRRELCRKTNSHALKYFEIFERHNFNGLFVLKFLLTERIVRSIVAASRASVLMSDWLRKAAHCQCDFLEDSASSWSSRLPSV